MGLVKNIVYKLNTRKYNNMKKEYLKELKKTGVLPSIDAIQKYIGDKGIHLISQSEKIGDELDSIEEIFFDNDEISSKIFELRKEQILNAETTLESKLSNIDARKEGPAILSKEFEDFKKRVFKFDDYYSKNSENDTNNIEDENSDKVLEDAVRLNSILRKISQSNPYKKEEMSKEIFTLVSMYSLTKLNEEEDFLKKVQFIEKAEDAIERINQTISEENKSQGVFMDFVRRYPSDSTKEFLDRIDEINELEKYGICIDLTDNSISFIDALNEEKVREYYEKLEHQKEDSIEKEFSEKDFAMVRTTEFFPEDKEMEILDELNYRTGISNFLSDRLYSDIMKEKYGEDYADHMWTQDSEDEKYNLMKKDSDAYSEKFKTLSTGYRSTKHFTLNGLVSSHEYGDFSGRTYIFIDPLEEHIHDEGIQSINEADTYFKISREKPFKLSEKAELMMPIEEYIKAKNDPEMMKKISEYKVTLFRGDEKTAVDMKLSKLGYIPENIGKWGYNIDGYNKFSIKLDREVSKISEKTGIPISIHFHSEVKEDDQEKMNEMTKESNARFVEYIFEKFGIDEKLKKGALKQTLTEEQLDEIFAKYGKENIINAIEEFNQNRRRELDEKREEYTVRHKEELAKEKE